MHKILLVDDDPEDRSIIIDALTDLDASDSISCAENGEVALASLDQFAKLNSFPCLIILDLNMPKLNGTQTLQRLKADPRFDKIPVIIYSTSINPLEREACMNLGAELYITKPTSYHESLEIAKMFLEMCKERGRKLEFRSRKAEVGSRK